MPNPIKILLCDDHFVVRSGLTASLELENDLEVVAEASDEAEAIEAFNEYSPDLVLMDLQLGEDSGINATKALRSTSADARILIFSSYARDLELQKAVEAGALGFLQKNAPREELIAAVRTVAAGHRHLPADVALALADSIGRTDPTPRETEVLALVAKGNSNKEIASELSLSEETVKHHISNLLKKLNARDRTQAVTEGLRRGLFILD